MRSELDFWLTHQELESGAPDTIKSTAREPLPDYSLPELQGNGICELESSVPIELPEVSVPAELSTPLPTNTTEDHTVEEIHGLWTGVTYWDTMAGTPHDHSCQDAFELDAQATMSANRTDDEPMNMAKLDFTDRKTFKTLSDATDETFKLAFQAATGGVEVDAPATSRKASTSAPRDNSGGPQTLQWLALGRLRRDLRVTYQAMLRATETENFPRPQKVRQLYKNATDMLQAGLSTFQRVLEGQTPNTLKDVLAFVCVAKAMWDAILKSQRGPKALHHDPLDGFPIWWSAVTDPQDRVVLCHIASELWGMSTRETISGSSVQGGLEPVEQGASGSNTSPRSPALTSPSQYLDVPDFTQEFQLDMRSLESGTISPIHENFATEVTSMLGETAAREDIRLSDFLNISLLDVMDLCNEPAELFRVGSDPNDGNTNQHQLGPNRLVMGSVGHVTPKEITPVSSTSSACFPPSAINPKDLEMHWDTSQASKFDEAHHGPTVPALLTDNAKNASPSKTPMARLIDTWLFKVVAKCLQGEK